MQSFLVALCMAILEKLITKGTDAWLKYEALRSELEKNKKNAEKYDEVVKSGADREKRRKAEDDVLG